MGNTIKRLPCSGTHWSIPRRYLTGTSTPVTIRLPDYIVNDSIQNVGFVRIKIHFDWSGLLFKCYAYFYDTKYTYMYQVGCLYQSMVLLSLPGGLFSYCQLDLQVGCRSRDALFRFQMTITTTIYDWAAVGIILVHSNYLRHVVR